MNKIETPTDFSFGSVPADKKEEAKQLIADYVGEKDGEKFLEVYDKHPNFIVSCINKNGEVVGVCFGYPRENGRASLQGIAIRSDEAKSGLGSKLLNLFEKQVKEASCESISLGSAEGYVEHFYLKNKYEPTQMMIKTDRDISSELSRFDISQRMEDNKFITIY